MSIWSECLRQIRPVNAEWIARAEQRQLQLTKPPRSLGRMEELANRCAAIHESFDFTADQPRMVIFAADHGVCAEGVSPYPQEVTAQMVLNFLRGGAGVNAFTRANHIELKVIDVGVASPLPEHPALIGRRVANGTRNFCSEPAMTEREMQAAIEAGIEAARAAAAEGCNVLGFGEMGIGNTTAASAVTAALTGQNVREVVGRGAGLDDEGVVRKISAVERALALHGQHFHSPWEILRRVGGLELAAMCGFCLGAAAQRLPVVTDGFIATAGAAIATQAVPAVKGYLFASHCSVEPGHAPLFAMIGSVPLLHLDLRLGEGTGASLAIQLIRTAVEAFTRMATFDSAGVSGAPAPATSA